MPAWYEINLSMDGWRWSNLREKLNNSSICEHLHNITLIDKKEIGELGNHQQNIFFARVAILHYMCCYSDIQY